MVVGLGDGDELPDLLDVEIWGVGRPRTLDGVEVPLPPLEWLLLEWLLFVLGREPTEFTDEEEPDASVRAYGGWKAGERQSASFEC